MNDISDAELDVLNALWQGYPASARDIVARLSQHKDWHEKTVKTLLSRLVKKQVISYEQQQRHYLYTPLIEKQDYVASHTKSLVGRLFKGRFAPLVAGFASSEQLSQEDVNALKQLIDDWEKNRD